MTSFTPLTALLGGILIGLAASLLLATIGRIAGISGILAGIVTPQKEDFAWRLFFFAGLLAGGVLVRYSFPAASHYSIVTPIPLLLLAGLLVGYGTRLGGGCTSGHGVCGVARLSPRSLVATLCFLGIGFLVVFVMHHLLRGPL